MEEEVENRDLKVDSPQLPKKYVIEWRSRWITSDAESIDDFIEVYEESAEMMKHWKAEGIKLDPDIDEVYGADYTQFYTYDKEVALEEGFKEHTFEERIQALKNDSFKDWDDPRDSSTLEFSINDHLSLKKIDDIIKVYVDEEPFDQCRYLLIVDPQKNENQDEIDSIDEAESLYNGDLETEITPTELGITKEQEFWAHCSNIQAWAENGYDTRLLHSNLSFPLLKKLTEVGDEKASKVFKDEIAQRFVRGYIPVMRYLFREKYLDYLTPEEFDVLLTELDYKSLNLNLLLVNIEDYRASKYGIPFLLRIRGEFLEFFTDNWVYVEVASHRLDKSEYSPIVITPDRQYFIRGSNDGKLKVFGIFNGDLVRVFGDHKGQSVSTIAISNDGKYVASSSDTLIKVWDYKTGTLLHSFQGHRDDVNVLAFDPESHHLASEYLVGASKKGDIILYNFGDGKVVRKFIGHTSEVIYIVFSPNCRDIISVSDDNSIKIWDLKSGININEFQVYKTKQKEDYISSARLSHDGNYICVPLDTCLRIWDTSTGEIIQDLPFRDLYITGNAFFSLAFSHDNTHLAFSDGSVIYIWRNLRPDSTLIP